MGVKKATLESFSLRHVTYAPVWKGTYDKRKRQGEGVNARHSRGSIVACCCCDEGRIYRPFSASSLVNLCPTRKEEPSAPSGATMQPIFGPPFPSPSPLSIAARRRGTPPVRVLTHKSRISLSSSNSAFIYHAVIVVYAPQRYNSCF